MLLYNRSRSHYDGCVTQIYDYIKTNSILSVYFKLVRSLLEVLTLLFYVFNLYWDMNNLGKDEFQAVVKREETSNLTKSVQIDKITLDG